MEQGVPGWLRTGAGWGWRLLVLGVVLYLAWRTARILDVVIVPCVAALLLTALLEPSVSWLRRRGWPAMAATWCTLLAAAGLFTGFGLLVADRVSAGYSALVADAKRTTAQVESWLAGPPFRINNASIRNALNDIPRYLSQHKSLVEGTVVTGGRIVAEVATGFVLMLFVTFFLLKDGDRIWEWLVSGLRPAAARRASRAGSTAWHTLIAYMRGTVAVAAVHAVVVGIALWVMGVPLVLPQAVLVFIAAFIPIIGLLLAGTLSVLITLAAKGVLDAVILVAILVIEDQLEGHLLQPQLVGRAVRLHPLAIILALATGTVIAGIPGAVAAVPVVAVITRVLPELRVSAD